MDDEQPPLAAFHVLCQSTLSAPSKGQIAGWNPLMDLIAFAMQDNSVMLHRLNGQLVWTIPPYYAPNERGKNETVLVEILTWRPDGKLLAIGYSNGLARICDVATGKFVHRVHTNRQKLGKVTTIGWTENGSGKQSEASKSSILAQENVAINLGLKGTTDEGLPPDLFDFDVSQVLPKLSVLPSSASTQMNFTVKSSLDNLINSTKVRPADNMDVLLVGGDKGRIVISIFDSFEVGNMKLSSFVPQLTVNTSKVTHHVSTSTLKSHILLISHETNSIVHGKEVAQEQCLLFPMDLLFLTNFGPHLSQLAYTVTKVQYCLRYIKETIKSIAHEYKTMEAVGSSYIRPLDVQLREEDNSRAGLELFELLVTGVPSEKLKLWLVDELMERGQKKWEKICLNGYEVLRRLIHEHLFPSCERAIVLLSRLRGLARWKGNGSSLGLEAIDYTRLLDLVSGLLIQGHDFLIKLNKELELFTPFVTWLKCVVEEFDALSTGGDPPITDDNSMVDTIRVSEFIEGPLLNSELAKFFSEEKWEWKEGESILQMVAAQTHDRDADTLPKESEIFVMGSAKKRTSTSILSSPIPAATDLAITSSESGTYQSLPGFHQIWDHLSQLYKSTFAKPAKAMQQQLRIGSGLTISSTPYHHLDMRMVTENNIEVTYIAISPNPNSLILLRIELSTTNSLSTLSNPGFCNLSLPPGEVVKDFKFIDGNDIILLSTNPSSSFSSQLITFTYTPPVLAYTLLSSTSSQSMCEHALSSPLQSMQKKKEMVFQHETFEPREVVVNGTKGRRVGALVDVRGVRWNCFDVDAENWDEVERDEEEGEAEIDEDEDMAYA